MAAWHETMSDTIVARATPFGVAALAIVRLSGDDAIAIAESILRNVDLEGSASHTAHVGYVQSESGAPVDQVVATVFRAPNSATGQDVVEISCHGGHLLPARIVRLLTSEGARPATAGEFTQRAFLNGKLDLAQAESVAELIHADSAQAGDISVQHLQGRYSELLESIRTELMDAAALIELELDFSEEDVEFADRTQFEQLLSRARIILEELVSSYRFGRLAREGIRVVIAGRPNAGKSTLLNALLGYERAIVSETAGTTRDSIEAEVEYDGLRIKFVDTAGIRETGDEIESEGVRRSRREIEESDVVLYLYDVRQGLTGREKEWLSSGDVEVGEQTAAENDLIGSGQNFVVIANKMDLVTTGQESGGSSSSEDQPDFRISATQAARDAQLLDQLLEYVVERVRGDSTGLEKHRTVLLERHYRHLTEALGAVTRTHDALDRGASGDLLAIDIRSALDNLGMITGTITNEDVLDQIFSRFCIGK